MRIPSYPWIFFHKLLFRRPILFVFFKGSGETWLPQIQLGFSVSLEEANRCYAILMIMLCLHNSCFAWRMGAQILFTYSVLFFFSFKPDSFYFVILVISFDKSSEERAYWCQFLDVRVSCHLVFWWGRSLISQICHHWLLLKVVFGSCCFFVLLRRTGDHFCFWFRLVLLFTLIIIDC